MHVKWTKKQWLAFTLILIMLTDGHTGERIGEAENPGHNRRGPNGGNHRATPIDTKKEHIWLRSHNVGSFRNKGKREDVLSDDIDIYALQETNADIKTMHDAKAELNKRQIRTIWSNPVDINKKGSGTAVSVVAPLYTVRNSLITLLKLKLKN